jgi:hypothetical protein
VDSREGYKDASKQVKEQKKADRHLGAGMKDEQDHQGGGNHFYPTTLMGLQSSGGSFPK